MSDTLTVTVGHGAFAASGPHEVLWLVLILAAFGAVWVAFWFVEKADRFTLKVWGS